MNELMNGLTNIGIFIVASIALYYIYMFKKYYIDGQVKKNGLWYTWDNPSSAANPPHKQYISGHKWTPIETIKSTALKNKQKADAVYVDNFRFFDDYLHDAKIPFFLRNKHESIEYYLEASKLCRSMLVVGSAGSGKTVFLNNLLNQNWYDKAVIFSKKMDFEPYYFRGTSIDILINPKMQDSVIHNIFDEPMEYVEVFIETLKNAALGDKDDYFSTSAMQEINKYIQKVKIAAEEDNLSVPEKWELFLTLYEEAYQEATGGKQNSLKDVFGTIKSIVTPLYLMAYRIIEGAPTFTVKEFFDRKEPCKLFLTANDPSVEGLVAATYSVVTKYQLSLPNGWSKKPVLHLQDEYNSLKNLMPERILIEQREVGRAKMFATIIGVQDLKADVKVSQELLVSMQYLVVFGGTDTSTLNFISDLVGDVVYENLKENESFSNQGKNSSFSTQKETQKLLTNYHMNILQEEGFSHLFISLKEKLLFKGYTPEIELKERDYNDFSTVNLNKFYKWKLEKEEATKKEAEQKKQETADASNSALAFSGKD